MTLAALAWQQEKEEALLPFEWRLLDLIRNPPLGAFAIAYSEGRPIGVLR